MPQVYFYPGSAGEGTPASPSDVLSYAKTCLAKFRAGHSDPAASVLGQLPTLRERAAVLAGVGSGDKATIERYWSQQEATYASLAEEMVPPADSVIPLRFACLDSRWQGFAPGTIVAVRDTAPVGVLAVFDGWSVDADGRLSHATPATSLPHASAALTAGPAAQAMGALDDLNINEKLFEHSLTVINYIAQGLSGVFPIAGPIISAVIGLISQGNSAAMGGGVAMLDAFAQQLKASDAELETDLAQANVMTYQQWAAKNYQDSWVNDVMTGDATSRKVLNRKKTLDGFVSAVSSDLTNRSSELLTAVNLMMTEQPVENSNLNNPTLAMLKSPGFFFMSNYVLALGKQAFTAQLTMEGDHAAAKIGKEVAYLSKIYSQYASDLKAAVDKQIQDRLGMLHLQDQQAVSGNTLIYIYDDYDPDDPSDPAGHILYRYSYCGNDEFQSEWAKAQAQFAELQDSYRTLFWSGDPATREQAVAAMLDNDTKLQATATPPPNAS
jgi:hypothetical protein